MKKFFHTMACHNPSAPKSDCYQVLRMTVIKTQLLSTKSHLLPASNYAAMRANRYSRNLRNGWRASGAVRNQDRKSSNVGRRARRSARSAASACVRRWSGRMGGSRR
eukprot:754830-Prymnesium_polylepis.1